jgi:tRNA threonylcarbamoyl adenosine modification protein (Sua5/YciO/YrdC/YwlC family)
MSYNHPTRVQINWQNPQVRWINRAVEILHNGGLVAYPTDSRYGLGCDIFQKGAIERIYQIKKFDYQHPFSLIFPDLKNLSHFAHIDTPKYKILKRCLPGPYTFILDATREIPKVMLNKRRTIGIRIPDSPIVLALTRALQNPIVNSSVPSEDELELNDPEKIEKVIGHAVDIILDGGVIISEPSTVFDLTGTEPILIRQGKGDPSLVYLKT